MRKPAIIFMLLCCTLSAVAHRHCLKGLVRDDEREALPGVAISVSAKTGQLLTCAVAKPDGRFVAEFETCDSLVIVEVGLLGYRTEIRELALPATDEQIFDLEPEVINLKDVNVVAKPIRAQGDTLIYNVSAFKSGADNTIEDVLKRMPGITVHENGSIAYQGKPISDFYIEGLDMLQGRYTLATRNISADDIATVDVYENHQPIRVLENVVYSDKAALNLSLKKKSLMRPIGRISAGGGYGNCRGLWTGELSALMVSPVLQLMAVGKTNNVGMVYGDEMSDHMLTMSSNNTVADDVFLTGMMSASPIAQRRYDFNRSEIISVNAMSRRGENTTIGLNISYDCNRSDIATENEVTYFREGEDAVIIGDNMSFESTDRRVKANAVFSINEKTVFLKDRFAVDGMFRDNSLDVNGTENVSQGFGLNKMAVSNILAFTARRGQRVWEVRSALSYVKTPSGDISVTRFGSESPYLTQSAAGAKFYNSESTSMSWLIGSHVTVGGALAFSYTSDSFKSVLGSEDGDEGISVGSNDVSGSDMRLTVRPFFVWENRRLNYRLEVPLLVALQRYSAPLYDRTYKYSDLYPEIDNSLFWKLGFDYEMKVKVGYRREAGGFRNFITEPIYVNYRTLSVLGNGHLGLSDVYSSEIGLRYREPVKAVFASLSAKYSFIHRNSTVMSFVSDDMTSSDHSTSPSNTGLMSLATQVSKRLTRIGTTFRLSVSWGRTNTSCIRNDVELSSVLNSLAVAGSMTGSWLSDRLVGSLSCAYIRSVQNNGESGANAAINSVTLSSRLSAFPHPLLELFGRFDYRYSGYSGSLNADSYFVDAGIRFRVRRWEFELQLNNLTGQKTYEYAVFDGPDYIVCRYRLRPFEAVALVRMTF